MRHLGASSIVLFVLVAVSLGVVLNEIDVLGAQESTQEPRKQDGPEKYATFEETAQAAGFTLPSISAPGWSFKGPAYVQKSTPAGSNTTNYAVQINFERQDLGSHIEFFLTPEGNHPDNMPETVTLADGREVRFGRQDNQVGVRWNEGGRSITAITFTSDAFTEADFLSALATLKY
jgi:hypothetical protein